MNKPWGVGGLANCLMFVSGVAAAEGGVAQASAGVPRTATPGCAKLVCQRRAPASDRGMSAERPAAELHASGVSLLVAVGVGVFQGPKVEGGLVEPAEVIPRYPEPPPGSALIDSNEGLPYEPVDLRRTKFEGPAVSLGVSMGQPLLAAGALGLGLEERLTLTAVLPLSGGTCWAGMADIMLTARHGSWPVQVALGPSLAVAQLDVRDEEDGAAFEGTAILGAGAALLRLDLAQLLPGTLDLVGHYGQSLNYDAAAAYRDLQLGFSIWL